MKVYASNTTDNKDLNIEKESSSTIITKESRLELQGLSKKDKRRKEKLNRQEIFKVMTKREKANYIFCYYKWNVLGIIVLTLFITILPITIYKNTRPVAISYAVINTNSPSLLNTSFIDDFRIKYDRTKGYRVYTDFTIHLDLDTYLEEFQKNSDSSDYTKFPMQCFNGTYDFIISDKKGIDYCVMQEIIFPIDTYFEDYVQSALSDYCYHATNTYNDTLPYAIDISKTPFAASLNLDYSDIYIAFPGTTENNYQTSLLILNYIFDIPLSLQ